MGWFSNNSLNMDPYGTPAGLTLGKMYDCISANASGDDRLNFACEAREELNSIDNDGKVGWSASIDGTKMYSILICFYSECNYQTVSEFLYFLELNIDERGRYETFAVEWRTDAGQPDYITEHPVGIYYNADTGSFVITGDTRIPGVRSKFFAL